jgi:hypothetical protein
VRSLIRVHIKVSQNSGALEAHNGAAEGGGRSRWSIRGSKWSLGGSVVDQWSPIRIADEEQDSDPDLSEKLDPDPQ